MSITGEKGFFVIKGRLCVSNQKMSVKCRLSAICLNFFLLIPSCNDHLRAYDLQLFLRTEQLLHGPVNVG